jgi:hypothetical protein
MAHVLLLSKMFLYNGINGYNGIKNLEISFSKTRWGSNMEEVLGTPNFASTYLNEKK